jgi:hypothetical protein
MRFFSIFFQQPDLIPETETLGEMKKMKIMKEMKEMKK